MPAELVVAARRPLSPRVVELTLAAAAGGPLPPAPAGAHLAVEVPLPDGPAWRRYSLIDPDPSPIAYRIAVQREDAGAGGSRWLHAHAAVGARLPFLPPEDGFPPPAGPAVLIAGGIGITPIASHARALAARGIPFALHYLAPRADDLVYADELRGLIGERLHPHATRGAGGARPDPAAMLAAAPADAVACVCGPPRLVAAVEAAAAGLGWAPERVRSERFGHRAEAGDAPAVVELALSGMEVELAPGRSVLDQLLAAGVFASAGCTHGACGMCATAYRGGRVSHRDSCLTPQQRDGMLCTCVSWPADGRLVLDL